MPAFFDGRSRPFLYMKEKAFFFSSIGCSIVGKQRDLWAFGYIFLLDGAESSYVVSLSEKK